MSNFTKLEVDMLGNHSTCKQQYWHHVKLRMEMYSIFRSVSYFWKSQMLSECD